MFVYSVVEKSARVSVGFVPALSNTSSAEALTWTSTGAGIGCVSAKLGATPGRFGKPGSAPDSVDTVTGGSFTADAQPVISSVTASVAPSAAERLQRARPDEPLPVVDGRAPAPTP